MARLSVVEGIGPSYEEKLRNIGIKSTDAFLKAATSKKGRTELAEKSEISEKLILRWANHVDLMRIKGIGGEFSEILEAAGVDTVPELARRNAKNLFEKIKEVNEEKKLVRRIPTEVMLEQWIEQARELPRVLEY
jgi:predicted flap endonuclease-1-like 5' DNA nuclease